MSLQYNNFSILTLCQLYLFLLYTILTFAAKTGFPKNRIGLLMAEKVTQLYKTKSEEELTKLNYEQAKALFSENDLKILTTHHWMFNVNVSVAVLVFRSVKQEIITCQKSLNL